jgi:hypothetical protein
VRAQEDDFLLENERASLRIEVPPGWNVEVSENQLGLYGLMGNRITDNQNQPRTDVQVVFRHAEDLLGVLNEPIDLDADNPAEDYLFKYASRYAEQFEGTYDLPQPFITDDDIPGAAMLYVERAETLRLGQDVDTALSLSLVFALGEDELLIVLIDGPASAGNNLLSGWAAILEAIRFNDEPLPFADDALSFLNQFEPPDSLLERYQSLTRARRTPAPPPDTLPLPGQKLSITRGDAGLLFSRYEGWSLAESDAADQATLLSDDESARIELTLLPLPENFTDAATAIEAFAEDHEAFSLVGDPVPFAWGALDAAIAHLAAEDEDPARIGQLIIARARGEDVLLVMQFDAEADAPAQRSQDWYNTVTVIRWNGYDLPIEPLLLAMTQLPED